MREQKELMERAVTELRKNAACTYQDFVKQPCDGEGCYSECCEIAREIEYLLKRQG